MVTNIGNTLNKVADKLSALKTKSDDHDDEENVFLGIGFEINLLDFLQRITGVN